MTLEEAMQQRHSVRSYKNVALNDGIKKELNDFIGQCNKESGLHIQLATEEPEAFDSFMAHYGKFKGVKNYIAMIGKKTDDLEEKVGYYGEKIVLKAQTMGLNSCWVAMTYKKVKSAFKVDGGEKLCVVIALGYGETQGVAHNSKPADSLMKAEGSTPAWFENGVKAAALAPTAMNQQKFTFAYNDGKVSASAGSGFYTKIDLGIAKYHFELGAGVENFKWAE